MKIFVDTNIILDVLERRDPFFELSQKALSKMVDNNAEIHISALSVANIMYIIRKKPKVNRKQILDIIKDVFIIEPLNGSILEKSMETEFEDYEDGIQFISAKESSCEAIITRNKKDFDKSTINIFTPEEFLEFYEL